MTRKIELGVDRAIYLVDDETRTYRFLRRNQDWEKLDLEENERNKKSLNGRTRIFRGGSGKIFRMQ
jgi:hypothetical protein